MVRWDVDALDRMCPETAIEEMERRLRRRGLQVTSIRARSKTLTVNSRKIVRQRLRKKNWGLALVAYFFGLATMSVYVNTQLQCYRVIVIDQEPAGPMMAVDTHKKKQSRSYEELVSNHTANEYVKFEPIQAKR